MSILYSSKPFVILLNSHLKTMFTKCFYILLSNSPNVYCKQQKTPCKHMNQITVWNTKKSIHYSDSLKLNITEYITRNFDIIHHCHLMLTNHCLCSTITYLFDMILKCLKQDSVSVSKTHSCRHTLTQTFALSLNNCSNILLLDQESNCVYISDFPT